jgi:hypothetical protein
MAMTSKRRMVIALDGGMPDRLPVTTHHVMPYFLKTYMGGIGNPEFFDHFGLDAIRWTTPTRPDASIGEYGSEPFEGDEDRTYIVSDDWRISAAALSDPQYEIPATRLPPRRAR